jgi:hypothetical protein
MFKKVNEKLYASNCGQIIQNPKDNYFYFWPAYPDGCWSEETMRKIYKKIKKLNSKNKNKIET